MKKNNHKEKFLNCPISFVAGSFLFASCALIALPILRSFSAHAQDSAISSNDSSTSQAQPTQNIATDDGAASNQPTDAKQSLEEKLNEQFGLEFDPARHNFVPPFNEKTAPFFGKPKIGNPYQIENLAFRPFFPKDNFVESGMASWYGDEFHGKETANGGQFNMGLVSAAHRTLPLPAVAVIVNLRTGQSIKLVINDRGPFAKNRILDMSKQAANLIGYYGVGTAPVKVIFLRNETLALWKQMGFTVNDN